MLPNNQLSVCQHLVDIVLQAFKEFLSLCSPTTTLMTFSTKLMQNRGCNDALGLKSSMMTQCQTEYLSENYT